MAEFVPGFRPMEAAKEYAGELQPCVIQPKMDGIRCVTAPFIEGLRAYSRKLKPIPNQHVQDILSALPYGLDGELMVLRPDRTGFVGFNETQSAIMSADGQPEFQFIAFDCISPKLADKPYSARFEALGRVIGMMHEKVPETAQYLRQVYSMDLRSERDLPTMVDHFISAGWEGAMTRTKDGLYKFGRSTGREQWLVKHKRFHHMEVVIRGGDALMRNVNAAETDARGLTKRSSNAAGLVAQELLGAFVVSIPGTDKVFSVGTGFDMAQRAQYWMTLNQLFGKTITISYQELSPDGVPRFPVFTGFRMD